MIIFRGHVSHPFEDMVGIDSNKSKIFLSRKIKYFTLTLNDILLFYRRLRSITCTREVTHLLLATTYI
jgi:hypothetical protein